MNRRIDDLVVRCLDNAISSNREELLEKYLTPLANEVYWLREFANRVDRDNVRRLTTKLADHYLDMKEHLTATEEIDLRSASQASHEVRVTALAVRWHVCRQILERQPDVAILAGD